MNLPPTLQLEIEGGVGLVAFGRPDKLNAIDEAMWTGLHEIAD
jgi:enoyl-CoA hydratase/carnithine racemase